MKKRPRFIAFSTQKGGVGKTTFTVLAASYLHYARDYNVLLVDCDYPQHSIQQMRKRDSEMLDRSQTLHEMAIELFSRIEKPTFKILCAKPEECVDDALRFIEDSDDEFYFVFFDLAGTFNNDGIIVVGEYYQLCNCHQGAYCRCRRYQYQADISILESGRWQGEPQPLRTV